MKGKFIIRKSNWIAKIFAVIFPSVILAGCPAMYGSPYASYTTRGQVTNEEGKVLQGIQVSLADYSYIDAQGMERTNWLDSVVTDRRGGYFFDTQHLESFRLIVVAKDIDGEEGGGEYMSDTIQVEKFDYKGGGTWYLGHADVEVNFKLKKK